MREVGIETESCIARFALRMRLSMSAIGSVSIARLLPTGLGHPGIAPSCARSRRQIRQSLYLRNTARGRPQRLQRV
jgi:hypothetical protein